MVHLYGVVHCMEQQSLFESRIVPVYPDRLLLISLGRFPRGTKIGLEFFTADDKSRLEEDLYQRMLRHDVTMDLRFPRAFDHFWESLERSCNEMGHEVVFLEDSDVWFMYNQACVDAVIGNEELFRDEGESDQHYDRKRLLHNLRNHRMALAIRKVHEIDRDLAILNRIRETGVGIAVVGIGHSDYWVAHKGRTEDEFGVGIDSYSIQKGIDREVRTVFIPDANPDPRNVYDRVSLERGLRVVEGKRILDGREPNFIGTWDVVRPSMGYFEVYKRDGVIEDLHGTAGFKGEIDGRVRFRKKYISNASNSEANRGVLDYRARTDGNDAYGYFAQDGRGQAFFLTRSLDMDFVDMGMRWIELMSKTDGDEVWKELFGEDS